MPALPLAAIRLHKAACGPMTAEEPKLTDAECLEVLLATVRAQSVYALRDFRHIDPAIFERLHDPASPPDVDVDRAAQYVTDDLIQRRQHSTVLHRAIRQIGDAHDLRGLVLDEMEAMLAEADAEEREEAGTSGGLVLAKSFTAHGETWWTCSEMGAALLKAAHHKYIRRAPKPGGGYRYWYKVTSAGVAHSDDAIVPGAAFQFEHEGKVGHLHVLSVDGDNVRVRHDESGKTIETTKAKLREVVHAHHGEAIKARADKATRDLAAARKTGSAKQVARLEMEAGKLGVSTDRPSRTISEGKPREDLTRFLRKTKLAAKSAGDLEGALRQAGFYAQKHKAPLYVYEGNSYMHTVHRATLKLSDATNGINNPRGVVLTVTPSLEVTEHSAAKAGGESATPTPAKPAAPEAKPASAKEPAQEPAKAATGPELKEPQKPRAVQSLHEVPASAADFPDIPPTQSREIALQMKQGGPLRVMADVAGVWGVTEHKRPGKKTVYRLQHVPTGMAVAGYQSKDAALGALALFHRAAPDAGKDAKPGDSDPGFEGKSELLSGIVMDEARVAEMVRAKRGATAPKPASAKPAADTYVEAARAAQDKATADWRNRPSDKRGDELASGRLNVAYHVYEHALHTKNGDTREAAVAKKEIDLLKKWAKDTHGDDSFPAADEAIAAVRGGEAVADEMKESRAAAARGNARQKASQDLAAARRGGDSKEIARLEAEARKLGVPVGSMPAPPVDDPGGNWTPVDKRPSREMAQRLAKVGKPESRYQDGMDTAQIAKLARADLKKLLPAGVKVGIETSRYSMGSSISVTVKDAPFHMLNPEYVKHADSGSGATMSNLPADHPAAGRFTPDGKALMDLIDGTLKQYQRDRSDAMTDYSDVNFHARVSVDSAHSIAERKAILGGTANKPTRLGPPEAPTAQAAPATLRAIPGTGGGRGEGTGPRPAKPTLRIVKSVRFAPIRTHR